MVRFPKGTSFLFVGKHATMTREQARTMVKTRGGLCPSAVSADRSPVRRRFFEYDGLRSSIAPAI